MNRPRVLVATDRPDRLASVIRELHELTARTTIVAVGAASLLAARQLGPDLAVVDADHADACRTVLFLGQLPNVRQVVLLTDDPEDVAVERCIVAGATDVMALTGPPRELAVALLDRLHGVPPDRAEVIARRRRDALVRIAAAEAQRPAERVVNLTRLERTPQTTEQPRPVVQDVLEDIGPAQRRLVEGLREGRSCLQIAMEAGVTPSSVYGAKRRLARRLDVPLDEVAATLRDELPVQTDPKGPAGSAPGQAEDVVVLTDRGARAVARTTRLRNCEAPRAYRHLHPH